MQTIKFHRHKHKTLSDKTKEFLSDKTNLEDYDLKKLKNNIYEIL